MPIVIGAMGAEVRTRSRQRTPPGRPRPAREIISAAIVTVNNLIAVCTPATVVSRSVVIAPIATFVFVAA